MKKSIIVIGLAVSVIALNGCSTARGFGEDLEDLGRIIQGENATNYEQNRTKRTASSSNLSGTASVASTTSYAAVEPAATQSTAYVTSESVVDPSTSSIPQATSYPYPSGSSAVTQVTPTYNAATGQLQY